MENGFALYSFTVIGTGRRNVIFCTAPVLLEHPLRKKSAKAWEQSLSHQIPQEHLPDVKIVAAELINILTKHFQ